MASVFIFVQAKRSHQDPPNEHLYMVTEKDPNKALRIFGPGLHIEKSMIPDKEIRDGSYSLQLPLDGSGYVSQSDTWEKYESLVQYTDKTLITLTVFFHKEDSRISEYRQVVNSGHKETVDIQGKCVDYAIYDYPGNVSCPSDITCAFEEDGKTCFLNYTFPYIKKTVSTEERDKMIQDAIEDIRFMLSE